MKRKLILYLLWVVSLLFDPEMSAAKIGDITPVTIDGIEYSVSQNEIRAVNRDDGRLMWQVALPVNVYVAPNPSLEGDVQFNIVRAIESVQGEIRVRFRHGESFLIDKKSGKWRAESFDKR